MSSLSGLVRIEDGVERATAPHKAEAPRTVDFRRPTRPRRPSAASQHVPGGDLLAEEVDGGRWGVAVACREDGTEVAAVVGTSVEKSDRKTALPQLVKMAPPLHGVSDRVGPHHLPVARDPGDRQAVWLARGSTTTPPIDMFDQGRDGDAAVGVGGDDRACVLVRVVASLAESFRVEFSAAGPVQRPSGTPPRPIRALESHDADRMWLSVAPFWAAWRGRWRSPANSVTLSGPSSPASRRRR